MESLTKLGKGIIILPQHSILAVWQGSEHVFVSISGEYLVRWPELMYYMSHSGNPRIFRTLFIYAYSGIFNEGSYKTNFFLHFNKNPNFKKATFENSVIIK